MKIRRLQHWISEQVFGHSLKFIVGSAVAFNLGIVELKAQTWAPTTSANWNDSLSWSGGIIPASAATTQLTFGGSTDYTATNDLGDFTLNRLTVGNTGVTTIAGGTGLIFAGTSPALVINAGSGLTTISGPVTYSAATGITNSSTSLLTLTGTQAINGNLTFSGTGGYTLSGASTIAAARTITNNGSGLLTLGAMGMGANALTISGTGNTTIGGVISGTIAAGTNTLIKNGSGTLTLSGANTFTGNISLAAGTLAVNSSAALGAAGNTISIGNGTTIRLNGNLTTTTAATNGHTFAYGGNSMTWDTQGFTGAFIGNQFTGTAASTITKIGTGTLTFQTTATAYAGNFVVNQGTLRVTSNALTAVGGITINNGGQFLINDDGSPATFNIASGKTLVLNGTGVATNPGAFSFTDQTAGGTVATSPVVTWSNPVSLASDAMIGVYAGTSGGGRFNTLILSNTVTGPGNLTKAGPGVLRLNNAGNAYGGSNGTTTIQNGAIRLGVNNALPASTSLILGNATGNTSGALDLNGFSQTVASITTAGTGAANSIVNLGLGQPDFIVNQVTNTTYAGRLGGNVGFNGGTTTNGDSFNFVKSGTGSLTLSGTNTYTGSTTVNNGTLAIATAAALPATSPTINVTSGAVLDLSAVVGGYNFGAAQTLTVGRTTGAANDVLGNLSVAGILNVGGSNTAAVATISGNAGFDNATLQFDLSNSLLTGNDSVAIGGNLSFAGMNTLAINKLVPLVSGNYTLFTYQGTLSGDANNLNIFGAAGGRQIASIDTTTSPGSVLLAITGNAANLTWAGNVGGNVWDAETTANFTGAANNDNRFYAGDAVTFNNSGVGGITPVQIVGTLAPASMTISGTQDYTFSDGGGSLSGSGPINLNGTGITTLAVPITTTGMTTLNAGTLTLNAGGSIAGPVTMTNGIMNVTNGSSVAGPLTMTGGTVNATVAGAFSGSIAINGGTFIASNPFGSAINSSSITVSNTGVLQIGNGGTEGDITGTVALASGGTLAFKRSDAPFVSTTITGSGNIANNGAGQVTLSTALASGSFNFSGTGNLVLNGNISGTTALTQSGPGTSRLTGTNNQTGAINITGGKLQVGVSGTAGAASAVVTIDGGTYHAMTGQTNTQPFNIGPNGGTIEVTPYFDFVKSTNGISGAGNTLTITGGGTLALQGSGTSTISNVIVEEGIYRHTSARYLAANTTPYTVDVKPGGTLYNLDTTSFTGSAAFPFGNISDLSGSSLTFNGDGYTGDGGGGGGNGATTMFGAYLHALGELATTATNLATSNIRVPVILAGNSRFTLVQGSDNIADRRSTDRIVDSLLGGVSGPGGLILDGDGIGTLAINNVAATYQGPTRVAAGTLRVGLNNALPTGTTLTLGGTIGDNVPDSSGTLELNGFSQTVAGLGTLGSGSSNRIGNAVATNGALIVNYNGTTPQTFAGSIGYFDQNSNSLRNLSLTKEGTGTLVLSGTNDYTLATNVNAGTLTIANAASLPSNTAPVNVASGAVLDGSGVSGGYTFIAGRTLTLGRTTAPANDLVGSINLEGGLNIGGTNTVASATISGDLTLNSASFNVDLSNSVATGNDRLNIGGHLTANGLTTFFINQTSGTLGQGNYTLLNYGGSLTGNAANFALSGISTTGSRATYTIDTTTTAGAVLLNVTGAAANLTWLGNAGNNAWDLIGTANFSGATDNRFYNGDSVTFDSTGVGEATPVTINATLTPLRVTIAGSKDYTFSGTGSLTTESLTKNGSASLTLNVPVTSTTTTVNQGALSVGSGGSLTGPVTVAGGTLTGTATNSVTGSVTITSGTAIGAADGSFTGSVAISGGTFVALNPTGTAINNPSISVADTGVLQIGNGGTVGSITGPISFSNGGTLAYNRSDAVAFDNAITWNGNLNVNNQATGVVTRGVATAVGANSLTLGGTGETTFAGVVSGNGQIIKNDSGTVNLIANNSFNGTVTVNGGTMVLTDLGAGGDLNASLITINNSGKFVFGPDGNPDFPASTFITINAGGTSEFRIGEDFGGINLNGGQLLLSGGNSNLTNGTINSTFTSGTITSTGAIRAVGGSRAIIKTTPGVVTVTDTELNATGGLSILDGTISTNAGLTNTGALTLGDTATKGTLQLRTTTAQTIAKPATLNAGGGTIDVSESTGVVTWSGIVSGGGALEKAGAGTLILSGTNTYTGATTVSAGKLVIQGNSAASTGNIDISAGGTIGGSGTVGGLTTLASSATVAPGNSAGNLSFTSGLNLSAGGIYHWELGALSTSNPGIDFDTLTLSGGNLTLGGTSQLLIDTTALVGSNPDSGNPFWNSPQSWIIATGTNNVTGNFGSLINDTWTSGFFTTSVSGGNVQLNFTPQAIPEPGTLAFGALSLLGLAHWQLRKRRCRPKQS